MKVNCGWKIKFYAEILDVVIQVHLKSVVWMDWFYCSNSSFAM